MQTPEARALEQSFRSGTVTAEELRGVLKGPSGKRPKFGEPTRAQRNREWFLTRQLMRQQSRRVEMREHRGVMMPHYLHETRGWKVLPRADR